MVGACHDIFRKIKEMSSVLEFGRFTSGVPCLTTLLHYREKKKQCSNVVSEEVSLVKFPNSRTQVIFFTFFHDVNRLKVKTFLCFFNFSQ